MKHIKTYEEKTKIYYVMFKKDVTQSHNDIKILTAFKPYFVEKQYNTYFSIKSDQNESTAITYGDTDYIILPNNFTQEQIDILKSQYKYNL